MVSSHHECLKFEKLNGLGSLTSRTPWSPIILPWGVDSSLDEIVLLKTMQEIYGHHKHNTIGGPTRISPKSNIASLNKISLGRNNGYPDENYFKECHYATTPNPIEYKFNRP